jgi:hypothetical protein
MVEKKRMAAQRLAGQDPQEAVLQRSAPFIGTNEQVAPAPQDQPDVAEPGRPRRPGRRRALRLVQAGDLITAEYMNALVQAVHDLQLRVADLEAADDDDDSFDDISAAAV